MGMDDISGWVEVRSSAGGWRLMEILAERYGDVGVRLLAWFDVPEKTL